MQSYKAVTVVIIALMLTGLAGFFMQTSTVAVDTEYYDIKGNLNPSVQYESIDDWTEYNPMKNITGWGGDAEIPLTTTANQYVISPTILKYNTHTAQIGTYNWITNWNPQGYKTMNHTVGLTNSGLRLTLQGPSANYPMSTDNQDKIAIIDSSGAVKSDVYIQGGYSGEIGHSTTGSDRYFSTNILTFQAEVGSTTYTSSPSSFVAILPLSAYSFSGLTTNSVIHLGFTVYSWTNSNDYISTSYSSYDWDGPGGSKWYYGTVSSTVTFKLTNIGYSDFIYDSNTNQYYPAEKINDVWEKVRSATGYFPHQLVRLYTSAPSQFSTISYDIPEVSPATYANPFDFVKIPAGNSGIWDNSETNGVVRILGTSNVTISPYDYDHPNATPAVTISCPTNLPYKYYLMTLDFGNNSFTCKGVTSIAQTAQGNNNPQAYTLADYDYDMTVVGTAPKSVTALLIKNISEESYPKIEIHKDTFLTIRFYENESDIGQGVLTNIPNPNETVTIEFGVPGVFTYDIQVTFNGDYSQVTFNAPYLDIINKTVPVSALGVANIYLGTSSSISNVYIDSTKIAVDPLGALWGNASMYLEYFFPDQFEQFEKAGKIGTRVLFNGFVKYGDTMTINGTQFQIADGKLQYQKGVDADGNIVYDYAPLKGMAVDFILDKNNNVRVSLVFTEYGNMTLDLGILDDSKIPVKNYSANTSLGYSILSTGTWYWQSSIYDIIVTHEDKVVFDALEGHYSLDMTASCLLMIFFIIIITAVMQYLIKTEYSIVDWGITIASMAILLVMASTF